MSQTIISNLSIPYHMPQSGIGKKPVRAMSNRFLGKGKWTYHNAHQYWLTQARQLIIDNLKIIGVTNISKFRVNLVFMSGKGTRSLDIDGFSTVTKWIIDLISTRLAVNDHYKRFVEVAYIYGGFNLSGQEGLYLTVYQDD